MNHLYGLSGVFERCRQTGYGARGFCHDQPRSRIGVRKLQRRQDIPIDAVEPVFNRASRTRQKLTAAQPLHGQTADRCDWRTGFIGDFDIDRIVVGRFGPLIRTPCRADIGDPRRCAEVLESFDRDRQESRLFPVAAVNVAIKTGQRGKDVKAGIVHRRVDLVARFAVACRRRGSRREYCETAVRS
ncbi:MAG: hypothetical protein QNJ44_00810 [Rhodobacter sp.]|nr:hypothetical protein [Rhodobacter sp.]